MITAAQQVRLRRRFGLAKKPRRIPLPKQIPPMTIQREYAKLLVGYVRLVKSALKELYGELTEITRADAVDWQRMDSDARARALIKEARERLRLSLETTKLEGIAERFARKTSSYQKSQLSRQTRAALGVDVFTVDKKLGGVMRGFVTKNVALIQDLPVKIINDVEKVVFGAASKGKLARDLALQLDKKFKLGESRAAFIARDQIGTFYAQVNEERTKELGIDSYIWRTMQDERVRPEHEAREGETFEYANPPEDGNPGEPVMCRCFAEPIFSGILEGL